MSASGAIKAGRAFVEFAGEASELFKTMDVVEDRLDAWASRFRGTQSAVKSVETGLTAAASAADSFSARATAATAQVSANLTTTATQGEKVASAFTRISGTAVAATTAAGGFLARTFSLQSVPSFLLNIDKSLGSIGRMATIASYVMRGLSISMRLLGMENPKIAQLAVGLGRIGFRATASSFALWGVLGPLRLINRMASALGRVTGSIPGFFRSRGGGAGAVGLASVATLGASSAAQADEAGAEQSGGFAQTLMPLLTGLAIGGPVGLAAVGLGIFVSKALSAGAEAGSAEANTFLGRAGQTMLRYGQWISSTFTSVKDRLIGMFKSTGTEGESIFMRLERAVYPIIYAVENVWIPGFFNAIETIRGHFHSGAESMNRTWMDWIVGSIAALADFIANFDIYFQLAQQTVVLWASNGILAVQDFFRNIGTWFEWFGKNWDRVLLNAFDFAATIFINIGQNLRNVFSKIWEWVKSGFTSELNLTADDWRPLTEGYQNTLTDMPKIFTSEWAKTTPEIERLTAELGERQAKIAESFKPLDPLKSDLSKTLNQTAVATLNSAAAARLGGDVTSDTKRMANGVDETVRLLRSIDSKPGLVYG